MCFNLFLFAFFGTHLLGVRYPSEQTLYQTRFSVILSVVQSLFGKKMSV